MHPCQVAYAFPVASGMLFIGIKKKKGKRRKESKCFIMEEGDKSLATSSVFLASWAQQAKESKKFAIFM